MAVKTLLLCFFLVASVTCQDRVQEFEASYAAHDQSLRRGFLVPQNEARADVGLPPLKWSKRLEGYARWWAEQRKTAGCLLQHSNGPYGENIFWGEGKPWTPEEAARDWVGERQFYHYNTNSCDGGQMCGHYTQAVWKETTQVGCARVTCDNEGAVFMICSYDPPGNILGASPY